MRDENDIWQNRCNKCDKDLIKGGHYVSYGPKYGEKNYHLSCFNKLGHERLKRLDLMTKNMQLAISNLKDKSLNIKKELVYK